MASRRLAKNDDPKKHWVCEFCGRAHIDDSPPDRCMWCDHSYFDNLFDLMMASGAQTNHTA